jgi:hypothetical protein
MVGIASQSEPRMGESLRSIVGGHEKTLKAIQTMKNEITETLRELVEGVNHAIEIGDWKVDGRCDPDMVLTRAESILLNCGYRKDELTGTEFYYEEA